MLDVNLSRDIRSKTHKLRDIKACLKEFSDYLGTLNKQRVLELSKLNKYQHVFFVVYTAIWYDVLRRVIKMDLTLLRGKVLSCTLF